MATAGRTVAVSGLTVTLAVAGLLIFPQDFLRSMGYGAMAAVAVAMLASLTVLPAGLAHPGHPDERTADPAAPATVAGRAAWARLAHSVMRRPWAYLIAVVAVLFVLAAPVLHIRFGGIDTRALPTSAPSRIVTDTIARDFPPTQSAPIQVLVTGVASPAPVVAEISALPSVTGANVVLASGTSSMIDVAYRGEPTDPAAHRIVAAIRALRPPPGGTIGVTGATADLSDQLAGLGARLPWMLLFVIVVTCVLLFLAFGSVVLPIKAIVMNAVSLGAAFGAVVFIFQDGHFASWLGFTPQGVIDPTDPILMIAVLFGLATDYEVFLLSRIREEWDARSSGRMATPRRSRSGCSAPARSSPRRRCCWSSWWSASRPAGSS